MIFDFTSEKAKKLASKRMIDRWVASLETFAYGKAMASQNLGKALSLRKYFAVKSFLGLYFLLGCRYRHQTYLQRLDLKSCTDF